MKSNKSIKIMNIMNIDRLSTTEIQIFGFYTRKMSDPFFNFTAAFYVTNMWWITCYVNVGLWKQHDDFTFPVRNYPKLQRSLISIRWVEALMLHRWIFYEQNTKLQTYVVRNVNLKFIKQSTSCKTSPVFSNFHFIYKP